MIKVGSIWENKSADWTMKVVDVTRIGCKCRIETNGPNTALEDAYLWYSIEEVRKFFNERNSTDHQQLAP